MEQTIDLGEYLGNDKVVIRCHSVEQMQILIDYFREKFGVCLLSAEYMFKRYYPEYACIEANGEGWCYESWYKRRKSYTIKDFDEFLVCEFDLSAMDIMELLT